MATNCFHYIDEDLQSLRQMLSFRLDEVMPKEISPSSSDTFISTKSVKNSDKEKTVNIRIDQHTSTGSSSTTVLTTPGCTTKPQIENKPPYHYSELIEFALKDKDLLTVSEIYDWILQRFPYFKQVDEAKWKPAVRHTLTTNSAFFKFKKANRGYLWAYRPPDYPKKSISVAVSPLEGPESSNYHWKKKKLAEYHTEAGSPFQTSTPTDKATFKHPSSNVSNCNTEGIKTLPSSKSLSYGIIPTCAVLANSKNTIVLDSSTDDDCDSENESNCRECHCQVEYFIPNFPEDLKTNSDFVHGIPCCNTDTNSSSENCCCLDTSDSDGHNNHWSRLWNQIHQSKSSQSPENAPVARIGHKGAGLKKGFIVSPPSAMKSKSGHILYLPVSLTAYKKAAALKKKNNTAHLHNVPQNIAVEESGLLDEPQNLTQVAAIPSFSSVISSRSSTHTLDKIFSLGDLVRNSLSATSSNGSFTKSPENL